MAQTAAFVSARSSFEQVDQIIDSPSFSRVMKFGTPVQTCPPRLLMRKSSPVALNSMSAFE